MKNRRKKHVDSLPIVQRHPEYVSLVSKMIDLHSHLVSRALTTPPHGSEGKGFSAVAAGSR
jgi:hypothetical protein